MAKSKFKVGDVVYVRAKIEKIETIPCQLRIGRLLPNGQPRDGETEPVPTHQRITMRTDNATWAFWANLTDTVIVPTSEVEKVEAESSAEAS